MSAQAEVGLSILIGVVVAVPLATFVAVDIGLLAGWDTAMVLYMAWVWATVWPMDGEVTARRAEYTDPTRTTADLMVLCAAVASLFAVGLLLARASTFQGGAQLLHVALGLGSVALSWAVVHTVFALRYARIYYAGEDGGVDFNEPGKPSYVDFAYLAFTIGMTYQVSDTALHSNQMRRAALQHALLFGTGILATTVNLVASLSSG